VSVELTATEFDKANQHASTWTCVADDERHAPARLAAILTAVVLINPAARTLPELDGRQW